MINHKDKAESRVLGRLPERNVVGTNSIQYTLQQQGILLSEQAPLCEVHILSEVLQALGVILHNVGCMCGGSYPVKQNTQSDFSSQPSSVDLSPLHSLMQAVGGNAVPPMDDKDNEAVVANKKNTVTLKEHASVIKEQQMQQLKQADAPANVVIKNEEPIAVRNDEIVELLKKQNSLIEKNTSVNRKGFDALKPIDHQSFAELVKKLPPLCLEKEDKNWVAVKTVAKKTGELRSNLNKQRQRGESFPYEGVVYGRDTEERIWCHVTESRKIFYLASSLSGQTVSR